MYIVLYPRARILTLFPVFIFLTFLEVPAFVFLGIWGVQQFLNGFLSIADSATASGGIAWFAHIGGFALGALVGLGVRVLPRRS
jgi:membrane associated rhomboid family serine protease